MKNKVFLLIIGILFCGALIAGGTFALLTFNANTYNYTYNITTRHFTFTSATGTAVTNLYPFPGQPIRAGITYGNGYINLGISKAAASPKASSLKIILKFSTNEVTVDDYIKVALCRGSASDCDNTATSAIPSSTNSNWLVVNKSLDNSTAEQIIFDDTSLTNNPFNVTGSVSATYYLYFWLNSEVVTNENATILANSHVAGDVYFYATQGV